MVSWRRSDKVVFDFFSLCWKNFDFILFRHIVHYFNWIIWKQFNCRWFLGLFLVTFDNSTRVKNMLRKIKIIRKKTSMRSLIISESTVFKLLISVLKSRSIRQWNLCFDMTIALFTTIAHANSRFFFFFWFSSVLLMFLSLLFCYKLFHSVLSSFLLLFSVFLRFYFINLVFFRLLSVYFCFLPFILICTGFDSFNMIFLFFNVIFCFSFFLSK